MPMKMPRSKLTADQQRHVRANLMRSASAIANQMHEYITTGQLVLAGRAVDMSSERIAVWRLALDRTVPSLSATEITHKSGLEAIDSSALVGRLAELVKVRPELAARLHEALGERVIETVAADTVTDHNTNNMAAPDLAALSCPDSPSKQN